jgi:hypothetical protein
VEVVGKKFDEIGGCKVAVYRKINIASNEEKKEKKCYE